MPCFLVDILLDLLYLRLERVSELPQRLGVQLHALYLHGAQNLGKGYLNVSQNAVHLLLVYFLPQSAVQQKQRLPEPLRAVGHAVFRAEALNGVVAGIYVQQIPGKRRVEHHIFKLHAVFHAVGIQRLRVVGALGCFGSQDSRRALLRLPR